MIFIAHRINTIRQLKDIPKECGVEVDLRDFGDRLILQHEPFNDGEDFEDYLNHYEHNTLILNIKSERIEFRVLDLLSKHKITNYFFLDNSFPMINYLSKNGERKIALRFSEFEGLDTIINMKDRVSWVWIDYFNKFPMNKKTYKILKTNKLKICIVSPDLQGRDDETDSFIKILNEKGIRADAVCSKFNNHDKWNKLIL